MEEIITLLPDGVTLYERVSVFDIWMALGSIFLIIGCCAALIGATLMAMEFKEGSYIAICSFVLIINGFLLMFISNSHYEYRVAVSESADIDQLEENFTIIDKDDFVWTIKLKDTDH